jgi:hypothetical protein
LLAGAAILGGGYAAWHHHEENKKSEEEVGLLLRLLFYLLLTSPNKTKKDALTWGTQQWAKDSQAKTEEFRNHGPRGTAVTWVLVEGRDKIPKTALVAGKDKDNHPLYVCRAFFEHGTRTFYRWYFFHSSIHCPLV